MFVFLADKLINKKLDWQLLKNLIFVDELFYSNNILFTQRKIILLQKYLKQFFQIDVNLVDIFCNLLTTNKLENKKIIFQIFILRVEKPQLLVIPINYKPKLIKNLIINNQKKWQKDGNCNIEPLNSNVFWQNYFNEFDDFLCLNHKGRVVKSSLGEIVAIRKKILYFTDIRQKFYPKNPLRWILRQPEKLQLKKVIDKSNGLSIRLLSEADEVYIFAVDGFHKIDKIIYGKNEFKYHKSFYSDLLNQKFKDNGKKILCSLERT